ncbi:chemotaxis protein CheA [Paenibacillus turpanensis]|uniref:chemotaxis protein CheA n=1 Tax=Paenibacillus turpanensis TaxID=2689078 RepID=UPI001408BD65|nr:chemotaxis protein CheA [Paenibacillus turpanensis]
MDRQELTGLFIAEVEEQLLMLEQEILKLEEKQDDPKGIQTIFRAAHTLKGSSAAMGFDPMTRVTHEMENVLDQIRNEKLAVSQDVIDVLFACLDYLHHLKRSFTDGTEAADSKPLVTRLHTLLETAAAGRTDAADSGFRTAGAGAGGEQMPAQGQSAEALLSTDQLHRLQQAGREGKKLWQYRAALVPECTMKVARAYVLYNQLQEHGEVIGTHPALDQADMADTLHYFIASAYEGEELLSRVGQHPDVASVQVQALAVPEQQANQAPEQAAPSRPQPVQAASAVRDDSKRSVQTIRVDVDRLENLMNLVGELVIDQTRIAQIGMLLRDKYMDDMLEDLDQVSNHISRVIGDLQESVMKTRMLPIDQLFQRFPRMVRDLSQSLKKGIELVIQGRETELDRTVIEEISDPIIHLLRNSVDHGIESAEQRLAAGKPEKGTVTLRAAHQDNQVVLTVEDDGGGIHTDKLKKAAVSKGILTQQQADAMNEQEALGIIFMPGLSTSSAISEVSGRGVGMDIVRSHIEKLNGLIDVETNVGQGTKFTIKLPLTLAILRGLLVKLNQSVYALPMSSVDEIVRVERSDIYSIKGQAVMKMRERVIPLVWMHDHFRIPQTKQERQQVSVVVIGLADKRIGLVVDELVGNQEIVVKSTGSFIGKVEGVSGATILGDGSIALILDVTGIFKIVDAQKSSRSLDAAASL